MSGFFDSPGAVTLCVGLFFFSSSNDLFAADLQYICDSSKGKKLQPKLLLFERGEKVKGLTCSRLTAAATAAVQCAPSHL